MRRLPTTRATVGRLAATAAVVDAHRRAMWAAAPPYLPDDAVTVLAAPEPAR